MDIEAWYAQLAGSTFRTVFVPLTPDEARAMAAAYKARPKTWSWEDAEGGASGASIKTNGSTTARGHHGARGPRQVASGQARRSTSRPGPVDAMFHSGRSDGIAEDERRILREDCVHRHVCEFFYHCLFQWCRGKIKLLAMQKQYYN